MKEVISLFLMFFKIGLFTFGGGYAMLPLIQEEVTKRGLMEMSELINFVAISESTPGPFAVNIATYVGLHSAGLIGSVFATLGVVMPSFIVILIVARCYQKFQQSRWVQGALKGLRPAVVAMLLNAVINIGKTVFNVSVGQIIVSAIIFAVALCLAFIKKNPFNGKTLKVHPIIIIVISAVLGAIGMCVLDAL